MKFFHEVAEEAGKALQEAFPENEVILDMQGSSVYYDLKGFQSNQVRLDRVDLSLTCDFKGLGDIMEPDGSISTVFSLRPKVHVPGVPSELGDLIPMLKKMARLAEVIKEVADKNPEVKYTIYSAEEVRYKKEMDAIRRTQSLCTPERVARLRVGHTRDFPDGAKPGYAPRAITRIGAKEFLVELIETPSGSRFDSRITRIK